MIVEYSAARSQDNAILSYLRFGCRESLLCAPLTVRPSSFRLHAYPDSRLSSLFIYYYYFFNVLHRGALFHAQARETRTRSTNTHIGITWQLAAVDSPRTLNVVWRQCFWWKCTSFAKTHRDSININTNVSCWDRSKFTGLSRNCRSDLGAWLRFPGTPEIYGPRGVMFWRW